MSAYRDKRASPPGGRLPPLHKDAISDQNYTDLSEYLTTDAETSPARGKNQKRYTEDYSQEGETWTNQYNYSKTTDGAATQPQPPRNALMVADQRVKPKFLYDLEQFLVRELDSLKVADVKPSETRLQAHREVFEYLIEDFKSYKPILAAIKNEYEMMLRYQDQNIKQLEPLEQMLTTVTEQCDKRIMKIRDEEKTEMINVRKENDRLQSVIDSIKNEQFALQTQVEKLDLKHKEQYNRYREEADSRKLLVSDINDLRAQQEDLILQQQQASNKDKSDDPVVIRQLLKEARESERSATDKINDIVANYGDVIPKQDFINLQEQFSKLELKYGEKRDEFNTLKQEHELLLETQRQVIRQRDEFYQESERLRQTATPRPDWNRCANIIAGGPQRWQEISQGKSSDELVGILLNELAGTGTDAQNQTHFTALGLGEDVPLYLRWEGQVKNRNLGKRDTSLLIRDVWRQKDNMDAQSSGPTDRNMPMSEYFIKYLKSKFSNETMAYEWAYNIHNSCQRYPHDDKIKLFYGVLTNTLEEELYYSQIHYIVSLLKYFTKANEGHDPEGVFTQEEFKIALKDYFQEGKSAEDMEQLIRAANAELDEPESTDVEYTRLFFEDDEGKFGPFVDELKKQLEIGRQQYIQGIISNLTESAAAPDEPLEVPPGDLEAAIYKNDTSLDPSKIESLLLSTYRVTNRADLEAAGPVTSEHISSHLMTRHIKRFDQTS